MDSMWLFAGRANGIFQLLSYYFENKKQIARTCLFGNLENTKDNTDGVGIRFFYLL